MRAVFGLVLLIGMGLAGFAVYTVNGYFAEQEARIDQERIRAESAITTVDIYAPNRAITYGDLITIDDVQVIKYAEEFLPEGVYLTEEELFPQGTTVPRVAIRPMEINEPILAVKVTEPGAPRGVTALLGDGMRAFPLSDTMTSAFANQLRISDRIDLYWVGRVGDGDSTSRRVKSNLEIISMEEPDADGNGGGTGVVVQVSPQDLTDLQVLSDAGRLSLSPVGTSDTLTEDGGNTTSDISTILGIEEEVAPEPEAVIQEEQKCYITKRVNNERIQEEVPCS